MVGANQQCAKVTGEANQGLQAHSDSFHHPTATEKQYRKSPCSLHTVQVQRKAWWLKVTFIWLATFSEVYHACVSLQE